LWRPGVTLTLVIFGTVGGISGQTGSTSRSRKAY
jgi:hypothetical protein